MTGQQWCDGAAAVLGGAQSLMVVTGAGMSHDSGVPTFRDAMTGLWARYDPQELATETAFRNNPARVFGWYLWRWHLVRGVEPHAGYDALVRLESMFDDFLIATQNVDGLHCRSGSKAVVELHGSLEAFRCLDRGHPYDTANIAGLAVPTVEEVEPPRCPDCDSPIRPGVVWFGESLPHLAVGRAWSAVAQCDALIVVGTSALVYPAAELPEIVVRRGGPVVEINPESTPLSPRVTVSWPERAAVALPALVDRLMATRSGA
ncbi:MAG: NAD-dependent deacylase [Gemmatimonadota bacterium]|nr:MAG: NAD-dependent deacylase [Gemmatimonadota bacterium]